LIKLLLFFIFLLLSPLSVAKSCRDIRLQQSIDAKSLWQDFTYLASVNMQGRKSGSAGAQLARAYLQQRFSELNFLQFTTAANYLQSFHFPQDDSEKVGVNVVGWLKGTRFPDEFIVISAHFDHLGIQGKQVYLGADDNASGVAAMLALGNNLQRLGSVYSIIFLATDAEELGLQGAKAFMRHPTVAQSQIKFNLNLDMLAEGGPRKRLFATASRQADGLNQKIKDVAAKAGLCLIKGHRSDRLGQTTLNQVDWRKASDHSAFARHDIPYIFVGVDIHARYHTPKDSADFVDQRFYTAAVETAWLLLQSINQ
jgi:Zn-dependent M28 family amino/carboxypeptidase